MNIGFDISQTSVNKSGTGFYADQLIKALARLDKNNNYYLLPWFCDYRLPNTDAATHIAQDNIQNVAIDNISDENEIIRKLDIIHSNNFRCPENTRAKKIVVIHDVSFMDCPEFTTEANRLLCYKGTLNAMLNADMIIAVSEYTRDRIYHFFPWVEKSKIKVIYEGNRETLLSEKDNARVVEDMGLMKNKYFLSVGTIEPRKNYDTLLAAYKEYRDNCRACGREYRKLCIAGGRGWLEDTFMKKVCSLGLKSDVVVTGYVTDEALSNLYRYSYAFVYTTWYEGFGLPVLEAMNFRKPVIASNVTSVPEVTGNAAILIRPDDAGEFAKAMSELDTSEEIYSEMCEKSYIRSRMFSWDKAAQEFLETYEELALSKEEI